MGKDASLGEFTTPSAADDEERESGLGTGELDGTDESENSEGPDDPTPTVTTYGWTLEGVRCEACGETTERRWRDGDAMVCRDCKEW